MKPPGKASAAPRSESLLARLFASLFGAFLALSLLKFGNPPIMEKYVVAPSNPYEVLLSTPWPISWAYWLLFPLAILGFLVMVRSRRGNEADAAKPRTSASLPRRLLVLALPLLWLFWQCLATAHSVDPQLSKPTLIHFTACLFCFYLGFYSLSRVTEIWCFWLGLLFGFIFVLAVGWDQHLGGLKATREYFYAYLYKEAANLPPEYFKRIQSNRIFS